MIAVEQNTPVQLQRLGAQRQLYATAKCILVAQIVLSGPIAVASAFWAKTVPSTEGFVALWGIFVLLCDTFWLSRWLQNRRKDAVLIQESFDCEVLGLRWNEIKSGDRPDAELVKEQSDKYSKVAGRMPPLQDWYSPSVAGLPLYIGRLVCQRSNCWWDGKLRRRYAVLVVAILASICAIVLIVSLGQNYKLEDFLLKVIAPLAPALGLGYRQISEQMSAATRLDDLKLHCQAVWDAALSGVDEQVITARSRDLQNEIFESRRSSPLVFDCVFNWLRWSFEGQMSYAADALVAEANQRLQSGAIRRTNRSPSAARHPPQVTSM